MKRTSILRVFSVALVFVLMLSVFAGCTTTTNNTSTSGNQSGTSTTVESSTGTVSNSTALTDEEKKDLLYMAEEEKMARDVYITLYEKWNLTVFKNISRAEQTHMDSVLALIDKYGLQSPIVEGVGKFNNPDIQKLYNDLVERGSKSEIEALKVGALVEEVDIKDLDEAIQKTDKADIKDVYERLRNGSYNHLRAFVSQLENYGVKYTPQVLSQDEYQQIINSENTTGGPGGKGYGNGGN